MALSTRLAVTKRDRWSSQHPTLEGYRERKAVTLQPIIHASIRGVQHNARLLNEDTTHGLCKKIYTHRIWINLNCDKKIQNQKNGQRNKRRNIKNLSTPLRYTGNAKQTFLETKNYKYSQTW